MTEPRPGALGVPSASALYVSAVLGTGVLTLPGLSVAAAGPASVAAVLIVLAVSVPLAGAFAALAARHPDAGGVATFVRLALGDTAARASGYWFLFGVMFGYPVVATLGGEYVVAAVGVDESAVPWIAFALVVLPLVLAAFGLRVSARLQLVLTVLLVAVIVGVIALAAPAFRASNFTPFAPHGLPGIGLAVSLFVWAVAGWEAVTHLAGEFRRPSRTIPVATTIAIVVIAIAYLALQVVTVGVLGGSGSSSLVPFIDLVSVGLPTAGPLIVAALALVLVVGVLNVYVPAFMNLIAALARDGHLPRWFAKGAASGEVPRRALLLAAAIALVYTTVFFVFHLQLQTFILFHTSSMVAVYLIAMIAALRLLSRWSVGWWFAVIAGLATLGLLAIAGANLVVPGILAAIAVLVTLIRRIRARRA